MNFAETFPHKVAIGDERPALHADISDAEVYAIGKMTTSWAILEHAMTFTVWQLAKGYSPLTPKGFAARARRILNLLPRARHRQALPKNFATLPFETRLRIFQKFTKLVTPGTAKARLENIASRIANAQAERHDFTHGIWDWSAAEPAKITVDHLRKKGRRRHKKYDSEAMLNFAERIAQINFDLCYPRGIEQFYTAKAEAGGYMSRQFIIDISGIDTRDPTLRFSNDAPPPEIRAALDRLYAEHSGFPEGEA